MARNNRLEVLEGTAPSYWASYFINGDSSGMEESEIKQADQFAEWLGGNIVSCSDESDFMSHHDARQFGVLAADCVTYTALVEPTPVLFRADRSGPHKGEVTAIMPCEAGDADGRTMTCYAHIGQHGSCDSGWLRTTRPASADEYKALKAELESAPYRYHFKVYRRIQPWMNDARRNAARRK
jgi:hypothetical protein